MKLPICFDDVQAAAARLAGIAHRTPVMTSRTLDGALGAAAVFLKCENFQRVGAFKFRGGYNAMSQLDEAARARGVLTYSSGNHAQAIALSGRLLGIPTTIVMPEDAPATKLAATRGYGAEVVTYDRARQSREEIGGKLASERGLVLIPPYDHPHVAAGQGTAALELIEEVGELDVLLTPLGGGGLLSGSATAAKALLPRCRVIGVEPEAADDGQRSFRSGSLQTVSNPVTIADGAQTPSLGAKVTFPVIRALVDDIMTVGDDALCRAMVFAHSRLKIVIEPTAALPLAALLEGAVPAKGLRVGVIISGGNVDPAALGGLLARGAGVW